MANSRLRQVRGEACRRIWRIGVWEEFFGAAGEFRFHSLHRPQISKDLRAMQAKVIRPRFD